MEETKLITTSIDSKANPCPLCGKPKQSQRHLVCQDCHKLWRAEAVRALASDEGTIVAHEPWLLGQIKKLLADMDQLKTKRTELQAEMEREAIAHIDSKTAGQTVDPEVRELALAERRRILWDRKGGKKLTADIQAIEPRYALLKTTCAVVEAFLNKPKESTSAVPAEAAQPAPAPSSEGQDKAAAITATPTEPVSEEPLSLPPDDSRPARTLGRKNGDDHPEHETEDRHTVGSREPKGGRGGENAELAMLSRGGTFTAQTEE